MLLCPFTELLIIQDGFNLCDKDCKCTIRVIMLISLKNDRRQVILIQRMSHAKQVHRKNLIQGFLKLTVYPSHDANMTLKMTEANDFFYGADIRSRALPFRAMSWRKICEKNSL